MRNALIAVAAVACSSPEVRRVPPATPPPGSPSPALPGDPPPRPVELDVPPVIAPHGGRIVHVALADAGDAALTADHLGELRLWPALDGTREPVVVPGPRARRLALGRHAGELIAAIIDAAGGVEVLRLASTGGLRGRVKLAAEPAAEQVAIAGGTVLVRRADQSITGHGMRGEPRGALVPEPGQRTAGLAVRGAHALAVLARHEPDRRAVRRIALGDKLAWGPSIELPEPLDPIAVAPRGDRIAGVAADGTGRIVELSPPLAISGQVPAVSPGGLVQHSMARHVIGFFDDDRVALSARALIAIATRDSAGWTGVPQAAFGSDTPAVVAAGRAVAGQAAGLVLIDRDARVRFLGYRDLAHNILQPGLPIALHTSRGGLIWLDDDLRATRTLAAPAFGAVDMSKARLLDDRHAFLVRRTTAVWSAVIRDVIDGRDTPLLEAQRIGSVDYDHATRVLAIHAERDVARFRIDLSPLGVTPLRKLADVDHSRSVHVVDPARAGGVAAIAIQQFAPITMQTFTIDDDRAIAPPVKPQTYSLPATPIAVDRGGTVYASTGVALARWRDGKLIDERPVHRPARVAASPDGARFAVVADGAVIAFDAAGAERWRRAVWRATDLAWAAGGRRLIVATQGGMVALDAATGDRLVAACGWNFGVFDNDRTGLPHNTQVACTEP